MALTSRITPYNSEWPLLYDIEAARLTTVFDESLLALHHVGSTAVPGLAAKSEIDILAIVNCRGVAEAVTKPLEALGYRRGGDLSTDHHFFKRDIGGMRTHKLHICRNGHIKIAEMLAFRDHLRRNPEDRDAYDRLKQQLEQENTGGIGEYLEKKAPFIDAILGRK